MKKTVNWAILAPGIIANSMAFAMKESMKNDERICMYAVGSRNLERSIAFADKWGFKKAYGSYDDLLKDPEVDAVYISNPHAFHFDSVMQCLNAGKHVLCEKPAGCNLKQLSTMIETAKSKKLFFMEAMWTAFNPTVNAIRNVIDKGIIGEIKNIESHFCNRIPFAANGYEYEMIETTSCILEGKTESAVHPHSHSLELCKMMDDLRGDWGMKYPFEKN